MATVRRPGFHRVWKTGRQGRCLQLPGWRRLQERQATRPIAQPREARNVTIDLTADSAYTVGDRVFHTKFGYGRVTGIEGDKLDIRFDKSGDKKIVARFVMPADLADEIPF